MNRKMLFLALVISALLCVFLYDLMNKGKTDPNMPVPVVEKPAEKKISVVKYTGKGLEGKNMPAFTFLDEKILKDNFVVDDVEESALGRTEEERSKYLPPPSPDGKTLSMQDYMLNKYLALTLLPGDIVTRERVCGENVVPNLASVVREGMRAVSIVVSQSTSVGGFIRQGDYVDVVATLRPAGEDTITKILLQNIKVLAVGNAYERDPNLATFTPAIAASKVNMVTLELSPEDLEKLLYIESGASFRLILKNPKEAKATFKKPISTPGATERRVLSDLGYVKDPYSGTFKSSEALADMNKLSSEVSSQSGSVESAEDSGKVYKKMKEYDDGKVEIMFGTSKRRQIYKYGGPAADRFRNLPDKPSRLESLGGLSSSVPAYYGEGSSYGEEAQEIPN